MSHPPTPANTADQVAAPEAPGKAKDPKKGLKQAGVIVHGHLNADHYIAEAVAAGMTAVPCAGYTELYLPTDTPGASKALKPAEPTPRE